MLTKNCSKIAAGITTTKYVYVIVRNGCTKLPLHPSSLQLFQPLVAAVRGLIEHHHDASCSNLQRPLLVVENGGGSRTAASTQTRVRLGPPFSFALKGKKTLYLPHSLYREELSLFPFRHAEDTVSHPVHREELSLFLFNRKDNTLSQFLYIYVYIEREREKEKRSLSSCF